MKKKYTLLKNLGLLAVIASIFAACEKDFSNIDSDVVNSENTTNFLGDKVEYPLVAYNKSTTAFQSNGLPAYLIGHYNDPVFGSFSSNLVAQLAPSTYETKFGLNPRVDSVVVTLPYYSRVVSNNAEDGTTYELDSVYGNSEIKLSVYQNNYFLRNFDPGDDLSATQKYYSNGALSESTMMTPGDLEGTHLFDTIFKPSNERIKLVTYDDEGVKDSSYISPALRFKFANDKKALFGDLFFSKEGQPELSNRNNFLDYFRGFYFKAESDNADLGTMMQLNFAPQTATVNIFYTHDRDDADEDNDGIPDYADVDKDGDGTDDNGADDDNDGINNTYDVDATEGEDTNSNGIDDKLETENKSYNMSFSGNSIALVQNNLTPIPAADETNGNEKLYIKGAQGSMAVVDLFNGTVENEHGNQEDAFDNFLRVFRTKVDDEITPKRLVNEAFLEFYVDQSTINGNEPERVILYDLEKNTPLVDYFIDQSITATSAAAKIVHLPKLYREESEDNDGDGIKYKIRITEHIKNIFLRDSSNVKLGLSVTSNVNAPNIISLLDQTDNTVKNTTLGGVLTPLGTVLYGNNTSNDDKRARLTIYYTEPKN